MYIIFSVIRYTKQRRVSVILNRQILSIKLTRPLAGPRFKLSLLKHDLSFSFWVMECKLACNCKTYFPVIISAKWTLNKLKIIITISSDFKMLFVVERLFPTTQMRTNTDRTRTMSSQLSDLSSRVSSTFCPSFPDVPDTSKREQPEKNYIPTSNEDSRQTTPGDSEVCSFPKHWQKTITQCPELNLLASQFGEVK